MIIDKGREYRFEYLELKITSDKGKTIQKRTPELMAFVPIDYDEYQKGGDFLIALPSIEGLTNYKSYLKYNNTNYRVIRYRDAIKLVGKYKWRLKSEKETSIKVLDCPDVIWSSLNYSESPSERKWFLEKNSGLTHQERINVSFENWNLYELMIEFYDVNFYYHVLVETVYTEYKANNINVNSFEEWKEIISFNYRLNNYYQIKDDNLLEEYHTNYLRDILKLWK